MIRRNGFWQNGTEPINVALTCQQYARHTPWSSAHIDVELSPSLLLTYSFLWGSVLLHRPELSVFELCPRGWVYCSFGGNSFNDSLEINWPNSIGTRQVVERKLGGGTAISGDGMPNRESLSASECNHFHTSILVWRFQLGTVATSLFRLILITAHYTVQYIISLL